jgi:hypothetical protein
MVYVSTENLENALCRRVDLTLLEVRASFCRETNDHCVLIHSSAAMTAVFIVVILNSRRQSAFFVDLDPP